MSSQTLKSNSGGRREKFMGSNSSLFAVFCSFFLFCFSLFFITLPDFLKERKERRRRGELGSKSQVQKGAL
jgi:hypothetical protein